MNGSFNEMIEDILFTKQISEASDGFVGVLNERL